MVSCACPPLHSHSFRLDLILHCTSYPTTLSLPLLYPLKAVLVCTCEGSLANPWKYHSLQGPFHFLLSDSQPHKPKQREFSNLLATHYSLLAPVYVPFFIHNHKLISYMKLTKWIKFSPFSEAQGTLVLLEPGEIWDQCAAFPPYSVTG